MTVVYVSDVLEGILEASAIRTTVRQHCRTILHGVPSSCVDELDNQLHYIAGKCMGYPAIWLVAEALELDGSNLTEALEDASGPLFISLTTSITDDFLDGDDKMTPGHMMLVYLMIFESLRRARWFAGDQEAIYLREVYPLIPGFMTEGKPPERPHSIERLEQNARAGERRIGAFHATIANAMISNRLPPRRKDELVNLSKAFGDWCAYIDDILDIEVDICAGANATLPIVQLQKRHGRLAHALASRDVSSCREAITAEDFRNDLISTARRRLANLAGVAADAGFTHLSRRMHHAAQRVEHAVWEKRLLIDKARGASPFANAIEA